MLAQRPDHPDALHLLGVIIGDAGQTMQALNSFAAPLRSTQTLPIITLILATLCAFGKIR